MTPAKRLVSTYEKGAMTGHHLVVQSLLMIDPDDPGLVLSELSDPFLIDALNHAQKSQVGRMVSNYGTMPTADQIEAAILWINNRMAIRPNHEASPKVK